MTRLLADYRRILGPEHPETLTVWHNYIASLANAGYTNEAVSEAHTLLITRRRLLGADHVETRQTWRNYAIMLADVGRFQPTP